MNKKQQDNSVHSRKTGLANEKLILSVLKQLGPLSQTELAAKTGLGSSTISYIVGRLRAKNLITERPGTSHRPGVKPIVIEINPAGRSIITAEVNADYILIGLFDFNCELLDSIRTDLPKDNTFEKTLSILEINILGLLSKAKLSQNEIIGIGITVSGSVLPNGHVEFSSTMQWRSVPLGPELRKRIDCPVLVCSTRVRLLAEISGDNDNERNIVYFNIANGIGANVIVDGKLLHGTANNCGELGHVIFDPDGPLCGCGNRGCLEALISGPAIAEKIKKVLNQNIRSSLKNTIKHKDTAEQAIEKWVKAFEHNDPYSLEIKQFVSEFFTRAAAIAINLYDPERIILGGYVTQSCPDFFIAEIEKAIALQVYNGSSRNIQITMSKAGKLAHIKGAALAVLRQFVTEPNSI